MAEDIQMINTRPKRFRYIVISNTPYDLNFRLDPRIDRKINSYLSKEVLNKVPYFGRYCYRVIFE